MAHDAGVLVVGAGPTGLLLAAELRRRGVGCRLVDAEAGPRQWDRATVVHPRSLEVFEALGLLDAFLTAGVAQRSARVHAGGGMLGEIELAASGSRHPFNLGLSEQVTEAILSDHLARQGGEVERGVRLVALEPVEEGVVATVERDGARSEVPADWVVGCDGLHSVTRGAAGIALAGHDLPRPWAVFDVTLRDWSAAYDANHVYLDEVPVILTALPGRRWRVYLRPASPESDLVAEAAATISRYQPGVALDDVTDPARFHCHTRVATRYRSGRILVAGDAAHVCSPVQGHGMNSGVQDAFNLGWKLALVCRGHASPALLDSYEAERRPVAETITQEGDEADQLEFADPGERLEALRALFADPDARHHEAVAEAELDIDYGASPIVLGDALPGLAPGQRLPDALAPAVAGRAGHALLLLGAGAGELEGAVSAAADPELVEATTAVAAPDGVGVEAPPLLAVRPDGHVGLVATHDHARALTGYQALLRAGRR